jgi:hypothetical protein
MKKMIKCLLLTLLVIILNCCITNKIIYDKSIPADKLCSLEIPDNMTVTSFNGEKVKWKKGIWTKTLIVKIPAGEHVLIADYLSQSQKGNFTYITSAKDLKVKYDFKPGVEHILYQAIFLNRITVGVTEIYR